MQRFIIKNELQSENRYHLVSTHFISSQFCRAAKKVSFSISPFNLKPMLLRCPKVPFSIGPFHSQPILLRCQNKYHSVLANLISDQCCQNKYHLLSSHFISSQCCRAAKKVSFSIGPFNFRPTLPR